MHKGKELEEHVQYVYTMLLNMKDEGVVVSRNATLFSNDGIPHEIDVYYEFKRAGVTHRVAIECKNTSRPTEKGRIQEFESKIRDLKGVVGVFVSQGGYQKNAQKFAEAKGILPLKASDLPSMTKLLAEKLKTVAIPDETYVGEPFWTIMSLRNGKDTGSFFATLHPDAQKQLIPLVFSKPLALQVMAEANLNQDEWVVRGLPRYALYGLIVQLELFEQKGHGAMIGLKPADAPRWAPLLWIPVTRQYLINEYYGESVPKVLGK